MVWNLGGNAKNANQGCDVENQGENLDIAVEMKQRSNKNGRFRVEWSQSIRKWAHL